MLLVRERERIVEFSILVSEEDKENEKWVFFFFFFLGCFLNEVAGSLVSDSGQTLRWVLRSVWLTRVGVCICFVLRFFFFS